MPGAGHGDIRNLLPLVRGERSTWAVGPVGHSGEFYYMASEIRAPCAQMQGPYMFLGCSRPFYAAPAWESYYCQLGGLVPNFTTAWLTAKYDS